MGTERTYFKKEEDFLKSLLDKTGKVYSVIESMDYLPITPELLLSKNFTTEYLSSKSYSGSLVHTEGIFRNQSGIYLYLSKTETETSYKMKIIYNVLQLDEVILFIKNLMRLK